MTFAIGEKHIKLIEISLASEDSMMSLEQTFEALLRASLIGHSTAVEALVDKGLNVNATDQNGWIPLLEAVFAGHSATVRVLLDRGADVNATDQTGWTPLMEAVSKGHTEITEILLAYGAATETRTLKSRTALSVTIKGNRELVRLLTETMNSVKHYGGAPIISSISPLYLIASSDLMPETSSESPA